MTWFFHASRLVRQLTSSSDLSSAILRSGLAWMLVFAFWTLVAVVEAIQTYYLADLMGRPIPFSISVLLSLAFFLGLGALTPVLVWLGHRFPLDHPRWVVHLAFLLAVSIALAVLKIAVDVPVELLIRGDHDLFKDKTALDIFQIFFNARFLFYMLVIVGILGVSHALRFYHKYKERELRTSQLEAKLAHTQLQMLKMQLHPHFLFNTLHAISSLMHRDVELADRMLARLGELLRSTLEHAGTQEVTLREELEFVHPYLEIERARLGSRLSVEMDIEPEVMDAYVPNLLLQPLLENAIRHGIAPLPAGGRIVICAFQEQRMLVLAVSDTGPGLSPEQQVHLQEGVGLSNTRARLRQLYGAAHKFELRNLPAGGLAVTIELPFWEKPEDPSPSPPLNAANIIAS